MSFYQPYPYGSQKRKVFVSYHHGGDQEYYDAFSKKFADQYELIYDNSLDRIIGSGDCEYVMRRIREDFLTGSSCTIVLCGAETYKRKYVDWEIKATLDKCHGLIGLILPSVITRLLGGPLLPPRLEDNLGTMVTWNSFTQGYALALQWNEILADPGRLKSTIEIAVNRQNSLVKNDRLMMSRNG